MSGTMDSVKSAAIETYVTVCSADAREIRAVDEHARERSQPQDDRTHIDAAATWLCRAHDMGFDDGVSGMFSLVEGWMGSYPETTGYIIPTMFDLADHHQKDEYRTRAIEMADWLLTCQLPDGPYPGSFIGREIGPRVFNTGQIIFGLVRAGVETANDQYLQAAIRAGDWLLSAQDDDGAWRRFTLDDTVHAYNARTAWALLRLAMVTGERRFGQAALANAEWTADRQDESGWFTDNTFRADDTVANLHTIAYATRGMLEIGDAAGRAEFIGCAHRAAGALLEKFQTAKTVAGAFGPTWSNPASWRCLPGETQLAIVWLRLDQMWGHDEFKTAAVELLEHVKAAQIMDHSKPDLCGGITGSVPINGSYERYCVVNWGPKFLIDALLLKASANGEHPTG